MRQKAHETRFPVWSPRLGLERLLALRGSGTGAVGDCAPQRISPSQAPGLPLPPKNDTSAHVMSLHVVICAKNRTYLMHGMSSTKTDTTIVITNSTRPTLCYRARRSHSVQEHEHKSAIHTLVLSPVSCSASSTIRTDTIALSKQNTMALCTAAAAQSTHQPRADAC